jgi:hypothetical protein
MIELIFIKYFIIKIYVFNRIALKHYNFYSLINRFRIIKCYKYTDRKKIIRENNKKVWNTVRNLRHLTVF